LRRDVFQKLFFILLALLLSGVAPVFAEDNSLESLGFIEPSKDSYVTTSRIPRPYSKSPENTTVITANDISRINAHTLAEVLQTIPGIQLDFLRTPTTYSIFKGLTARRC
jgi:vitamin B12 transporter